MQVQTNLEKVLYKIMTEAKTIGRPTPRLIAVSKGQSIEKIQALINAGWKDFGESYVQEWLEKIAQCPNPDIQWHYIGQLQSRKIKSIVQHASSIHALASLKHARLIDTAVATYNKGPFPVYLAVNLEGEVGKSGVSPNDLLALAQEITQLCKNLKIMGVMCVPPSRYNDNNYQEPPPAYLTLRQLADEIGEGELSLGMSQDMRLAIAAGTSILRIGSEIFGERKSHV